MLTQLVWGEEREFRKLQFGSEVFLTPKTHVLLDMVVRTFNTWEL